MNVTIPIFLAFVALTLGLSFYLGRRAKSASGYFAAHGSVGPFVNGVAFAGDYLSAASFLGICGLIAFYGYDGFLYSIGFLAGWVVALFLIAEPVRRLGKYTFADALDAKFGSRGVRLAAAVSTLVVSTFYLVPQMVGAGTLIRPLLGIDYVWGVALVGGVVTLIVTTAGMVSTTWVQFIKGGLLVVFCLGLTIGILKRGISPTPEGQYGMMKAIEEKPPRSGFVDFEEFFAHTGPTASPDVRANGTGPVGPIEFLRTFNDAAIFKAVRSTGPEKEQFPWSLTAMGDATKVLVPGEYYTGLRVGTLVDKLDFVSLMLALFCGTAALPHILIRYYTVKDAKAARQSTVVGIAAIGFFYVLTLYIGLGAMVSGRLDPTDTNMAAPLLARSFNEPTFAVLTGIAFTTVLGTTSGLILAAAGAVAHDLAPLVTGRALDGARQVRVAKIASVVVGLVAIGLGVAFKGFNVGFLVGWAFNVAASANLPALLMLLFWRGTTRQGIVWSVCVGLATSVGWVLLSGPAFKDLYGLSAARSPLPFGQPAIVTVPLAFAVLVVVSLLTGRNAERRGFPLVPSPGTPGEG